MDLTEITRLRKEKGLSMVKLSEASGVNRMKISRMEKTGDGKFSEAMSIMEALGYMITLMRK